MNEIIQLQLTKYPYLKILTKYFLFITKEELDNLKNSETITINDNHISLQLLKNILTNEYYYDYTYRFFTNEISLFKICYIVNGDTTEHLSYSKLTIINGLSIIIDNNYLSLTPDIAYKYETLKEFMSFEKFQTQNKNNNYQITIDNITYTIPITNVINTLLLPPQEFNNLCTNHTITTIHNLPKEHYLYAIYHFIEEHHLLTNYLLPSAITDYYHNLKDSKLIDLQALNHHLETTDPNLKRINLHKELETAILRDLPKTSTPLEKAIYIYLKMCKTLTYDEEYYATNKTGPIAKKHQDINYISTITPNNNSIVCFEFNLIFAKFLNIIGLNFTTDADFNYGQGHANLEFRYQKFLIRADSVTSILNGDLLKAKLNQPLTGLICLNTNENTQSEFTTSLSKMYQLIINQENNPHQNTEPTATLDNLLTEYSQNTTNIYKVSLQEKLSILIEKVNSTKLPNLDSLSYILQLRKIIFNKSEITNNFKITILRNNQPINKNKSIIPCAILSVNPQSFETAPNQTTYYYFTPNNNLIPISHIELQTKFTSHIFEYINDDDPHIPNIIENGGHKR